MASTPRLLGAVLDVGHASVANDEVYLLSAPIFSVHASIPTDWRTLDVQ